jgi:hypothetical protein
MTKEEMIEETETKMEALRAARVTRSQIKRRRDDQPMGSFYRQGT